MTTARIYLDHNATSPVRPEAARAVARALIRGGNPSSVHAEGRKAQAGLEESREAIAEFVGGLARNVTFTSGATESLNLLLTPSLKDGADERPWRLFMSATEHPAVLRGHRFPAESAEILLVGANGVIDLDKMASAFAAHPGTRPLVALQLANNETGVLQPVPAAAEIVKQHGGILVCDAVPAAGRVPVELSALGADVVVLSGHKLGAPAGIGAFVRAKEALHVPDPLIRGGGQEKGLRGGTENISGAAGFAAASKAAQSRFEEETTRLQNLRDRLEDGLRAIDAEVVIFGSGAERLPNTVCFAFSGAASQTALIALDLAGVAVSAGSACSSGKSKPSHVLEAMGVSDDIARRMLRASMGWNTTEKHVETFLEVLTRVRANSAPVGKVLAA